MASKKEDEGQLVVVRRQPGERLRRFLLLVGFTVFAGILGFLLGAEQFHQRYLMSSEGKKTVAEQRDELQRENTELRQRLIRLERSQRIDEHSLRQTRETIRSLQEEINDKDAKITFYRAIMAPEDLDTGLQIFSLDLDPTRDPERWRYNLVLTQIGDNSRFVSGHVNVELIGYSEGERKSLPLETVSEDLDQNEIRYRFRYFQTVDGDLTLPPGFEPEEIRVVASNGGRSGGAERSFLWHEKAGDPDVREIED